MLQGCVLVSRYGRPPEVSLELPGGGEGGWAGVLEDLEELCLDSV